jgi:hypothetical protein
MEFLCKGVGEIKEEMVLKGHSRMIEAFHERECFDQGDKDALLHSAVKMKRPDMMNTALDIGANPNGAANMSSTLLHACLLGYREGVQILLRRGADVQALKKMPSFANNMRDILEQYGFR